MSIQLEFLPWPIFKLAAWWCNIQFLNEMGTEKPVATSIYNTALIRTVSFQKPVYLHGLCHNMRKMIVNIWVRVLCAIRLIWHQLKITALIHKQRNNNTKATHAEKARERERWIGHSRQPSHKNNITTITKPPLKSYFHHKPLCSLSYYLFCFHHISHIYDLV